MMPRYIRCVILALAVSSSGCLTVSVRDWARDEVYLLGGRGSPKIVVLEIKNVRNLVDGTYSIDIPHRWTALERHIMGSGEIEVVPTYELQLVEGGWSSYDNRSVARMEAKHVAAPTTSPGKFPQPLGVRVLRDSGRQFRILVYAADREESRWIRLGEVEVGPGSQSSLRRPVSYLLYLITLPIDVATYPLIVFFILLMSG